MSFAQRHREMLSYPMWLLENDRGQIALPPEFDKLIVSLRTATTKGELALDKRATACNDTFDAFRMALEFFR